MNQNDMDRYRWRTGQRWIENPLSGGSEPSSRKKFPLLLIIIGACLFLALVLSFHGCGPARTASFDSRQRALQQKKLAELHGGSKNPAAQFAGALKAADAHPGRPSAVPQPALKSKRGDPFAAQFTGVTEAYDAALQKTSKEKK